MTGLAFTRSSMAHYFIQFSKNKLWKPPCSAKVKKDALRERLCIYSYLLTDTLQGQVTGFPFEFLGKKALFS